MKKNGEKETVDIPQQNKDRLAKRIVVGMILGIMLLSGAAIGVNWFLGPVDFLTDSSQKQIIEKKTAEEEKPVSKLEEPSSEALPVEERSYQPAVPTQEMPVLYQNPELPAGCEATAVAMLLQAYGYEIGKEAVAEAFPKSELEPYNGRTYAAHPNEAYVGSPFSSSGFGIFAKAAAETAQTLMDGEGGQHRAKDITGASENEILQYIDSGVPVCIWATMGMSSLTYSGEWYIKDGEDYTDEHFIWPGGEHCVVLTSYNESTVTVHDPLGGIRTYDRAIFFQRYDDVGQYAMILEEPE